MRGVLLISLLAVLFACAGPPDLRELAIGAGTSVEVSVGLLLDGDPAGAVRALAA
jgi:hypothetical protein